MNKSNSLWGKCILAIACMILCAGIYGEEAHAEEVSLERGEEVFYEGYSTFYYYINGKLGYCLEPKNPLRMTEHFRQSFWMTEA